MLGGRIASGVALPLVTLSVLVAPADVRMMTTVFLMPMGDTRWALGYRPVGAAAQAQDYIHSNTFINSRDTLALTNFLLQPQTQLLVISGTFTIAVNIFGHPFYGKVIADTV